MYKKKNKKIITIIVVISISVFFLLLSLFFSKDSNYNFLEKILKDSGLSINNIVLSKIIKEEEICNDACDEELKYQLEILKETLELNNTLNENDKINAIIINRSLDFWNNNITLNKGIKNNVEVGDAVVVKSGLVGKIISVSNYNSVAQLLTSETNNKISVKVKIDEGYAYGLLTNYDDGNNIYTLEGISETLKVNVDSLVTTTGIGNNFPSGIIIGNVKNITTDSYDLAKLIEVTPSVNFDSLSVVTILKRKVKE